MVHEVAQARYVNVTRYTTSAFAHSKLGAALRDGNVPAHIFDSADEARLRLVELVRRPPDG